VQTLEVRTLLSAVAVGGEFRVDTPYSTPAGALYGKQNSQVAMDADGDFVVVWSNELQDGDGFGVYGQRFNAAGVAQGAEFQVNTTTTGNQFMPTVAMDADGDFVVCWVNGRTGLSYGDDLYARRFNAAGVAQGDECRVNRFAYNGSSVAGRIFSPDIAMDAAGGFAVVWAGDSTPDLDGYYYDIHGKRYNADGAVVREEFLVNTVLTQEQIQSHVDKLFDGAQSEPSIAMNASGQYVVAWRDNVANGLGTDEVFARDSIRPPTPWTLPRSTSTPTRRNSSSIPRLPSIPTGISSPPGRARPGLTILRRTDTRQESTRVDSARPAFQLPASSGVTPSRRTTSRDRRWRWTLRATSS
jgi:hypothetical protein